MALVGTQLSLELGQTTWTTAVALRNLLKSASIDDVPPVAVMAMESLGSHLSEVNPRLKVAAFETLGGGDSYRAQNLKLMLGISKGGIAAEVRKSSSAIGTFLLVTALLNAMDTRQVSDVLLELLIGSHVIEEVLLGPNQINKLVETLSGHSKSFLRKDYMPASVFRPIVELATKYGFAAKDMFYPIDPSIVAKILLDIFTAVQDATIGKIRITGLTGALTFLGVLVWLFPDVVEILFEDGTVLVESRSKPSKVCVVLTIRREDKVLWHVEKLYLIADASSIIRETEVADIQKQKYNTGEEGAYGYHGLPFRVPCPLLLSYYYTGIVSVRKEELAIASNLALGCIGAVLRTSTVRRDNTTVGKPQYIKFSSICSYDFLERYREFPVLLGCPADSIDNKIGDILAEYMASDAFSFNADAAVWTKQLEKIDQESCNGALGLNKMDPATFSVVWKFSLHIADLALLNATRVDEIGSAMAFPSQKESYKPFVIYELLGGNRSIVASKYIQSVLLAAQGSSDRQPSNPLIACSRNGLVCYLYSLRRPPNEPRDAFAISIKPGNVRWRDIPLQYIYDTKIRAMPGTATDEGAIRISDVTERNLLRTRGYPFQYHLRLGIESDCAHLVSSRESLTDPTAQFIQALINWGLAMRPDPANEEEVALKKLDLAEISTLRLKHPAKSGLHCHADFPDQTCAVAAFDDQDDLQFLQFGSLDALGLRCIIQGQTTLADCAAQALEVFGSGWLIMAS